MKKQLRFLTSLLLLLVFQGAQAQDVSVLVGASPFQDSLWAIDTTTYAVTYRIAPIPSSGGVITGTNGIAKNPNSGTIYSVVKQSGVTGRVLGKLNVQTGMVSIVGNLGDNFSSITFRGDSLFGVTGDGATVPETVYLIDTLTAAKTLYKTLGNGADGEVICYNPTDDMIYHWSGNGTIVFEKFSPVNAADPVVNVPITGTTNGETFGMVSMGNNNFWGSNIGSSFNRWNANGTVQAQFGSNPDDLRGLIFYTCERQLAGSDHYCVGDSTELSVSPAISYQWFKDGAEISGATAQTYFASTPGVYNVRVHDVCGTDTLGNSITVVQSNLPNVVLTGNTTLCAGDSLVLTGSSGGTSQWFLNGAEINGATSNTLVIGAPGLYNMVKTNLSGCADSAAVGIAVTENPLPVVSYSSSSYEMCGNAPAAILTGSPAGGTFAGPGVSGNMFDPAAAGTGTFVIDYTYTDTNGCVATSTDSVLVNGLPEVIFGSVLGEVCEDAGPVNLSASPAGGTFSGTGVMGATFQPDVAGPGTFDLIYTYADTNGCVNTDTNSLTVIALPVVTASPAVNGTCYYDAAITLTGTPAGGTFTGTGVTGTAFDPSVANIGANTIVYSFTNAAGCTNTASFVVTVDSCLALPELDWSFELYPNPAATSIQVVTDKAASAVVSLIDVTGKTLLTTEVHQHTELNVSGFENGTYWIRIATTEGTLTRKIAILH